MGLEYVSTHLETNESLTYKVEITPVVLSGWSGISVLLFSVLTDLLNPLRLTRDVLDMYSNITFFKLFAVLIHLLSDMGKE